MKQTGNNNKTRLLMKQKIIQATNIKQKYNTNNNTTNNTNTIRIIKTQHTLRKQTNTHNKL